MSRVNPSSAEMITDSIFHVGKSLLSKEDYPMAGKWLQRAWDLILNQQLPEMSRNAVELRMAIFQALVTALLGIQTPDAIEKAHNLANYVQSEIGDQPVTLLMGLEILSKSPAEAFDGEAYGNILQRMIRSFSLNENNFKLLMSRIHMLHTKCPTLGCSILDEFLISLVKKGHGPWIDKAVVCRIKMATSYRDFEGTVDDATKSILRLEGPVSANASMAAQTVRTIVPSHYCQTDITNRS